MTGGGPLAHVRLYLVAGPRPGDGLPPPGSVGAPVLDGAWLERVAAAVRGGVDAVQLRLKGVDSELRRAALAALRRALPTGLPLVLNDDLAALHDRTGRPLADGLHLGREDAAALAPAGGDARARRAAGLALARERLGPHLALGTSTREAWEVDLAVDAGVDHVGFGAMAPSRSKPDTTPASTDTLAAVLDAHPGLAVFPIGGLDPARLAQLARLRLPGLRRAAVGAAVLDAPDPESAARLCRAALSGAQT